MTTFILVRHGESTGNRAELGSLMGGWTDLPLTERGLAQARALAQRITAEPRFDALYSSPLGRALDTARILGAALGDLQPAIDAGLREIGCGEVDGKPVQWVEEHYPREWKLNLAQDDPEFRWPGGESYREFRERVLGTLRRLAERHASERVLVVTHAGVISQVVGSQRAVSAACWERFRPHNGSLTEVRWGPRGIELMRFDDDGT